MKLIINISDFLVNFYNKFIEKLPIIQIIFKNILIISIFIIISFYAYNQININLSSIELEELSEIHFWFFSTIAQFNGAIIGLILATLGISLVIQSEKIIFLFKKNEFILLKITVFIFLLNTFFAILLLSIFINFDTLIKSISLIIILETWAIVFLGLLFVRVINSFENRVQYEVNLINTDKIIKQLRIEHNVSNKGINSLYILNHNQTFCINEVKVFASTGTCDITYHYPENQGFGNALLLSPVPKKLFDALSVDNYLNWKIIFKISVGRDLYDMGIEIYYMGVEIIYKKIDENNLEIMNKPVFQALTKKEYNIYLS